MLALKEKIADRTNRVEAEETLIKRLRQPIKYTIDERFERGYLRLLHLYKILSVRTAGQIGEEAIRSIEMIKGESL